MKRKNKSFKVLIFIMVFIIAGLTTFFIIKKINTDDKQVKGVFVINRRGLSYENEIY